MQAELPSAARAAAQYQILEDRIYATMRQTAGWAEGWGAELARCQAGAEAYALKIREDLQRRLDEQTADFDKVQSAFEALQRKMEDLRRGAQVDELADSIKECVGDIQEAKKRIA